MATTKGNKIRNQRPDDYVRIGKHIHVHVLFTTIRVESVQVYHSCSRLCAIEDFQCVWELVSSQGHVFHSGGKPLVPILRRHKWHVAQSVLN